MKMISLLTNVPHFNNDISEEIRLFLGLTDICFCESADAEMKCIVDLQSDHAICTLEPYSVSIKVPYEPSTEPLEKKRREKRAVKLAAYEAMRSVFPVKTPWGSLTGIRPTKLYREIAFKSSTDEADRQFADLYSVSSEKIDLVRRIHSVQQPIIESADPRQIDIYIGVPYCKTRCLYCSFGSEVQKDEGQLRDYLDHLKQEISGSAQIVKDLGLSPRCAYFGGGTPTVLSPEMIDELLTFLEDSYGSLGSEFTVEAGRPDTITPEKLKALNKHGISRISINPQSMNDKTLKVIGRSHSAADIISCFHLARDAGFDNVNMDVIAGLPGENSDDFRNTLDGIIKLHPDSLTVHTLAVKRSSRLIEKLDQYPLPSPEETDQMVKLGYKAAVDMQMRPYYMYRQKYMSGNLENVGYAVQGKECIYNVDMMEETLSIMAHGAHTISKRVFDKGRRVERIANPKDVPTYYAKIPALIEMKRSAFSFDK